MKHAWSASILALAPLCCLACASPPVEQSITPYQLLARSSDVALARVVGAKVLTDRTVQYSFSVTKRFAGPPRRTFTIVGGVGLGEDINQTFNDHEDKEFWESGGGRVSNSSDCQIHPAFSVGGHYLVFRGNPYTRNSFELIYRMSGAKKDKWLLHVEQYFATQRSRPDQSSDRTQSRSPLDGTLGVVGDELPVSTMKESHERS